MSEIDPYRPPSTEVEDVVRGLPGDLPLASLGRRLGGRVVDSVLAGIAFVPLSALPQLLDEQVGDAHPLVMGFVAGWALLAGGAVFVTDLVLWSRHGQSIGKRLLRTRIVRPDRSRATLGRIFWLRQFLPGVLGLCVGCLWWVLDGAFIFGRERRCLHDLMADTVVIDA